jgi:hypothetical protein
MLVSTEESDFLSSVGFKALLVIDLLVNSLNADRHLS